MLSRTHLRHFLAVVDTGSFTRAAAALNLAQPSLSGGIAELERQLGTKLFVRERRRIRLTEAGNALLPYARAIERDFHEAERRVSILPVPVQPIRLGILESFSTDRLASILGCYAGPEPLQLTEGNARELGSAMDTGAIDLALTLAGQNNGTHSFEALFEEDYCLALSVNHRFARELQLDVGAISGETMIARRSCEVLAETSRYFTERGSRPPFALRSANDDRAMAMVRAGIGVTVAPRSHSRPGIAMVKLLGFDQHRRVGIACGQHWLDLHGPEHPLLTSLRRVVIV